MSDYMFASVPGISLKFADCAEMYWWPVFRSSSGHAGNAVASVATLPVVSLSWSGAHTVSEPKSVYRRVSSAVRHHHVFDIVEDYHLMNFFQYVIQNAIAI